MTDLFADNVTSISPSSFEKWWAWYPKKVAKIPARAAYHKALRKRTPDQLMSAVQTLWRQHKDDKTFCPHAATWLNQERWTDYEPEEAPDLTTVSKPLELRHSNVQLETLVKGRIAQSRLIDLIGEGQWRAWFAECVLIEDEEGCPAYRAKSVFDAKHIRNHFAPQIERAWGEPVEVVV